MPAREPSWWYADRLSWQALTLQPIAALYGAIAERRFRAASPYRSSLPVICVGNITAGGTGKTPFAIALAKLVVRENRTPWFLTRGYGGSLTGPLQVDIDRHTARDVGDEPLLLALAAPTVIARDRRAGAELIEKSAPTDAVIIMDDGLQNPALGKDLTIALVDRQRGIGNGLVIPAGPLRAPLSFQSALIDVIATTGARGTCPAHIDATLRGLHQPIITAATVPSADTAWLRDRAVLAYAGIANPQRFFTLVEQLGARLVATRVFDDHHAFTELEARTLIADAARHGADLVTTEKDLVRLAGASGPRAELRAKSRALAITTEFDGESEDVLTKQLRRAFARQPRPFNSR